MDDVGEGYLTTPENYSFTRYLAAKKTVDDRALNAHVWETLRTALAAAMTAPLQVPEVDAAPPDATKPLRALEVGAGIGTMIERVVERGLFPRAVDYTALDEQPENIAAARARLQTLVAAPRLRVTLQTEDLLTFTARPEQQGAWDLLIAHAVLDLLDLPTALPQLLGALRPGGLFYFTLNFDGATLFQPEIDPALDAHIEALYHRTMDERRTHGRRSGDSRTGRHLFGRLRAAGAEIMAAGASDWTVFAGRDGYPADEAYFLRFIIHTIHGALRGHPELDAARFAGWIAERHAQIERGELVYIAHQMDFVGRKADGR